MTEELGYFLVELLNEKLVLVAATFATFVHLNFFLHIYLSWNLAILIGLIICPWLGEHSDIRMHLSSFFPFFLPIFVHAPIP